MAIALLLVAAVIGPVEAAPLPSGLSGRGPGTAGAPAALAADGDLEVTMSQSAVSYDASTNKSRVKVTLSQVGAEVPWTWALAVRGAVVASGSTSEASVSKTVTNNCSITTMSVTAEVADTLGRSASAASTLDRSLCPPPPDVPHAGDLILAGPTVTEDSFVERLRAVGSPALKASRDIYRTLIAAGVNPAFALGTFHAESHSGTRGYAKVTKNWGNILFYDWTVEYGATPYSPGNGYTYSKFPTWLAGVNAYAALVNRYWVHGYRTVSSASAHWLGTREGTDRHVRYLTNIVNAMGLLPDDGVPVMTGLSVPSSSRAAVAIRWSGKDNLGVTGYQVRQRKGSGPWSVPLAVTTRSQVLTLTTGTWTIAVRATDAAGNWSTWRSDSVRVDAGIPTMTGLRTSQAIVRTTSGRFKARWAATDDVGVTAYQWRTRNGPTGTPSAPTSTKTNGDRFRLGAGSWVLEVRARDAAGNWSAWRSVRVLVPRDDRAFSFSKGTSRRTGSDFYRGTLTTTRATNAQLATSTTDGDLFALVGRVGPGYGKLELTIDGTTTVIDTGFLGGQRATRVHDRVLLVSARLAPGPHAVTIRNLATTGRPTIAIDGLGFAR